MVYIDNYNAPYGRMLMCHMIADTTKELLEMVEKIGVNKKWIQYPDTYKEHFDICLSKKIKAVALGAIEITARQYVEMVNKRKDSPDKKLHYENKSVQSKNKGYDLFG